MKKLRSGEAFDPALLQMIEMADIFQLCWSKAAKDSRYVTREWRHALGQKRSDPFIRPTYWEKPMPDAPSELGHLHFSLLELD